MSSRVITNLHSRGGYTNTLARIESVWMAIKARHLQYTSTMTTTTRVLFLRTSLAVSKFSTEKCMNKFDCLVNEMLYIKQLTPSLNVQTDSIRAKVFV